MFPHNNTSLVVIGREHCIETCSRHTILSQNRRLQCCLAKEDKIDLRYLVQPSAVAAVPERTVAET